MRLTSLAFVFGAAFFAMASAQAQIGDDLQALITRWVNQTIPSRLRWA
jgi:hypothetical protein